MFYISYGSNINPIQMAHLCNAPVFIGTGILHDYDMDFYATTKDKNTANVYADVVKTIGAKTPVVVWHIEDKGDINSIDAFEGYPTLYHKVDFCKVTLDINQKEIFGFLYQMHENRGGIAIPTAQYFNTILYGYQLFDMDLSYLINRKGLQKVLKNDLTNTQKCDII